MLWCFHKEPYNSFKVFSRVTAVVSYRCLSSPFCNLAAKSSSSSHCISDEQNLFKIILIPRCNATPCSDLLHAWQVGFTVWVHRNGHIITCWNISKPAFSIMSCCRCVWVFTQSCSPILPQAAELKMLVLGMIMYRK